MKLLIKRTTPEKKQTLGNMYVFDACNKIAFQCKTLELPWLDNAPQKSCIPVGRYQVVKRKSPKYGHHFHVLDVPGRSYILIHHGNYYTDILGCILPGAKHSDINMDGWRDVTYSKATMKELLKVLPASFELIIE